MVCACNLGPSFGYRLWKRNTTLRWIRTANFSECTNRPSPVKILYFGSDMFSLGVLNELVKRMRNGNEGMLNIDSIGVVSSENPDHNAGKAKGKRIKRANEFIEFVKSRDLPLYSWNKQTMSELGKNYDFGVVASFGHLIPKKLINSFKRGMMNAHPSLLPRWRGAAPILHTILNGDTETGVSIIELSVGRFDKGGIFLQNKIDIAKDLTTEQLTENLGKLAGKMVLKVIDDYDYFKQHKFSQPEDNASNAPKVSSEISFVDWNSHTCDYLDRLDRAIGEKLGVHAYWKDKLVRITEFKILDQESKENLDVQYQTDFEVGRVIFNKKSKALFVKCIDGWISISRVQVEYKKPITATDFYNAYMVDRSTKGILHDRFS